MVVPIDAQRSEDEQRSLIAKSSHVDVIQVISKENAKIVNNVNLVKSNTNDNGKRNAALAINENIQSTGTLATNGEKIQSTGASAETNDNVASTPKITKTKKRKSQEWCRCNANMKVNIFKM